MSLTLSWDAGTIMDADGPAVCVELWSEEQSYRVYREVPTVRAKILRYKTWELDSPAIWLVSGTGLSAAEYARGEFPHPALAQALDPYLTPLECAMVTAQAASLFTRLRSLFPTAFDQRAQGDWAEEARWRSRFEPQLRETS